MPHTERTCPKGHRYNKLSDCPTCPVCEAQRKPADGFLSHFAAPARRALEQHGVTTVEQLSNFSQSELLSWHGIGPSSLPKCKAALLQAGLDFAPEK